jgi:MraZ protein
VAYLIFQGNQVENNPKKGTLESTLDDKGRVVIPASLRESYTGKLVITRGVEHCLWVMTVAEFEKYLANIKKTGEKLNFKSADIKKIYRHNETTAQHVEIDPKTGRIPINASLREYASLKKDCLVVDFEKYLEIWNAELNREFMEEVQARIKYIHEEMLGQVDLFSDGGQE